MQHPCSFFVSWLRDPVEFVFRLLCGSVVLLVADNVMVVCLWLSKYIKFVRFPSGMSRIPLASAEKLLRLSGSNRVSQEACTTLRDLLEDQVKDIARKTAAMAIHSRRKTVLASDVAFVLERFRS